MAHDYLNKENISRDKSAGAVDWIGEMSKL